MDDGRPSDLCADLAAAIGQLFDICLDLASWAHREEVPLERIEPMMKAADRALRELRVVMSVLLQLEQLPLVRPVVGRFPPLDALAQHAGHSDPAIPDTILLRLQQVIITARAAGAPPSATRGS